MLKTNYVPKPATKIFQKLEVNLETLSQIMVLGKPCNMKISFMKMLEMYMDLKVDLMGI
jgi:hypothetical protein